MSQTQNLDPEEENSKVLEVETGEEEKKKPESEESEISDSSPFNLPSANPLPKSEEEFKSHTATVKSLRTQADYAYMKKNMNEYMNAVIGYKKCLEYTLNYIPDKCSDEQWKVFAPDLSEKKRLVKWRSNLIIMNKIGKGLIETKDFEESLFFLRTALKLFSKYSDSCAKFLKKTDLFIIECYRAKGEPELALEELNKCKFISEEDKKKQKNAIERELDGLDGNDNSFGAGRESQPRTRPKNAWLDDFENIMLLKVTYLFDMKKLVFKYNEEQVEVEFEFESPLKKLVEKLHEKLENLANVRFVIDKHVVPLDYKSNVVFHKLKKLQVFLNGVEYRVKNEL